MKLKEMREEAKGLLDKDLADKIQLEKEELGKLKRNHAVTPIDNPMAITSKRKYIAILSTELNSRKNG